MYRVAPRANPRVTWGAVRHRALLTALAILSLLAPIAAVVAWLTLGGRITGSVLILWIVAAAMLASRRAGFLEYDALRDEVLIGVERLAWRSVRRVARSEITSIEVAPNKDGTEWRLVARFTNGKHVVLWTRPAEKELDGVYEDIARLLDEHRPKMRVDAPILPAPAAAEEEQEDESPSRSVLGRRRG